MNTNNGLPHGSGGPNTAIQKILSIPYLTMKKFSDLNIKPKDEIKKFNVPIASIQELVNCEIEVRDFVGNVKTQHGEDRYIVLFKLTDMDRKFFTNSSQIKNALDQCKPEDLPFTTVVKVISFGTRRTYEFT
jgi:hypothetical protein